MYMYACIGMIIVSINYCIIVIGCIIQNHMNIFV
jgi:hypothetical protein